MRELSIIFSTVSFGINVIKFEQKYDNSRTDDHLRERLLENNLQETRSKTRLEAKTQNSRKTEN